MCMYIHACMQHTPQSPAQRAVLVLLIKSSFSISLSLYIYMYIYMSVCMYVCIYMHADLLAIAAYWCSSSTPSTWRRCEEAVRVFCVCLLCVSSWGLCVCCACAVSGVCVMCVVCVVCGVSVVCGVCGHVLCRCVVCCVCVYVMWCALCAVCLSSCHRRQH
jgi:hypothetical protein